MHRVCWYAPFAHVLSQGRHASGQTCTIPSRSLFFRSFLINPEPQSTLIHHDLSRAPHGEQDQVRVRCEDSQSFCIPSDAPGTFGRPGETRESAGCQPPATTFRITASSSSSRATHGEQDRAPRDHGPTAQQGLPLPRAPLRGPGLYRTMTDGRRHGRSGLLARATGVDGKQTVTTAGGEVSQGANLAATTSRPAPTQRPPELHLSGLTNQSR